MVLVSVGLCAGWSASAADLPMSPSSASKRTLAADARKVPKNAITLQRKAAIAVPDLAAAKTGSGGQSQEIELSWFLNSLSANADGGKDEGAASMEGNLVVAQPGLVTSPYMVIEVDGHIVKTPGTTVRVDITVGKVRRSVNWSSDQVKSGSFSVSLNAPMKAGRLPSYFPVSAIALVSREGNQGVAMVSLEKIRVRLGKVAQVAANQ